MHGCPQCWGSSKDLKPWTQILIILWSHVYNKLKFPQESDIHIYKCILVAPKFQVGKEIFWSLWNNQAKTFCIICMYNYTLFSLVHPLPISSRAGHLPFSTCLSCVFHYPLSHLLRLPPPFSGFPFYNLPKTINTRTHTYTHKRGKKNFVWLIRFRFQAQEEAEPPCRDW